MAKEIKCEYCFYNLTENDWYYDSNNIRRDVVDRVTSVTQPTSGGTVTISPTERSCGATTARTIKPAPSAINPIVRGWMNYYGAFYRSALYPLLARINAYLVRWLRQKYKRLRGMHHAHRAFTRATQREPRLFEHWRWVSYVW